MQRTMCHLHTVRQSVALWAGGCFCLARWHLAYHIYHNDGEKTLLRPYMQRTEHHLRNWRRMWSWGAPFLLLHLAYHIYHNNVL